MTVDYEAMLKQFHEKYNHHIQMRPDRPHNKIQNLRYDLIFEEVNDELLQVMKHLMYEPRNQEEKEFLLVKLADALADSIYVIVGTAVAYGIPINEVFAEVHRSNMTKSLQKNKMGKTKKGESWQAPKLREILFRKESNDSE